MSQLRFSAATHRGNVRKFNEDRILALPEHRIWAVADGMGGHHAGDFAAQTVVDSIAAIPQLGDPDKQADALRRSICDAHTIILRESETRVNGPIGTTVTAFMATHDRFYSCWAGDSRLYRIRGDSLQMLTSDHSLVADLVSMGELSWAQAGHHPQFHVITRAVGADPTLELDDITGSLQRGDRFILCTDGLNNAADLDAQRLKLRRTPIERAADMLVQLALDGGGADNVSVVVIDVV